MSKKPPEDPGDAWSDVIRQVHDAMDAAQIHGEILREDLLEGVRHALESLEDVFQPMVVVEESSEDSPSVTVVDGGRKDDEPFTEGDTPELRIAEDCEEEEAFPTEKSADDASPSRNAPYSTTVRVVRTGPATTMGRDESSVDGSNASDLSMHGQLFISTDARSDQQTVYRGELARGYRLHCSQGPMRILLDGQPVETVDVGQSIDVEARLIRVQAVDGVVLQGCFIRLASS